MGQGITNNQINFIDGLVDGTKPACGLEAIEPNGTRQVCKYHLQCPYKEEQKRGVNYCGFVERLRALTDAMQEEVYL